SGAEQRHSSEKRRIDRQAPTDRAQMWEQETQPVVEKPGKADAGLTADATPPHDWHSVDGRDQGQTHGVAGVAIWRARNLRCHTRGEGREVPEVRRKATQRSECNLKCGMQEAKPPALRPQTDALRNRDRAGGGQFD